MAQPPRSRYGRWEQLRVLRERSEIRQAALASFVGISVQHLSNLENGNRWPSEDITRKLARALRVPPEMIVRIKDAA